jgi:hypothetical protein
LKYLIDDNHQLLHFFPLSAAYRTSPYNTSIDPQFVV